MRIFKILTLSIVLVFTPLSFAQSAGGFKCCRICRLSFQWCYRGNCSCCASCRSYVDAQDGEKVSLPAPVEATMTVLMMLVIAQTLMKIQALQQTLIHQPVQAQVQAQTQVQAQAQALVLVLLLQPHNTINFRKARLFWLVVFFCV